MNACQTTINNLNQHNQDLKDPYLQNLATYKNHTIQKLKTTESNACRRRSEITALIFTSYVLLAAGLLLAITPLINFVHGVRLPVMVNIVIPSIGAGMLGVAPLCLKLGFKLLKSYPRTTLFPSGS